MTIIVLAAAVTALAVLGPFLGADTRDGRDWAPTDTELPRGWCRRIRPPTARHGRARPSADVEGDGARRKRAGPFLR